MKLLLELQSIINETIDFKKEAAKHMKDMHDKNATPAARAYAQKMLQRALEASKIKDKEAATKHYMGVEEDANKEDLPFSVLFKMRKNAPSISVAHYKSIEDAQRFLDSVKSSGGNGIIRSAKKQGVVEGFKEPTDIDGITKLLNHVLAHEEDYPMGYARRLVSALEKAEKKSQPDLESYYKELGDELTSGRTKMPTMIANLFSQNKELFDMASKGRITPELKRIVAVWGESSPWGENTNTHNREWIKGSIEKLLKAYYPAWKSKNK